MGMSYGGKIVLLPGQSKAEEFSCSVHELGHELVHKSERRTATTKTIRETEAEAIAFVVSKAVGLETGTASADYIQLYHGNASLLAESLEVVQKASAVILAALEPKPEFENQVPQDDMAATVNSHQPYGGRLAAGGEKNSQGLSPLCQYRSYQRNESLDVTSQKEEWLSGQ
jgi:hypothetical protein